MIEIRLLLKKRKEGTDVQGLAYHGDMNGCITHQAILQYRLIANKCPSSYEDENLILSEWQDIPVEEE